MNFEEWFKNNLIVCSADKVKENIPYQSIHSVGVGLVINVSSKFFEDVYITCSNKNIPYFWFPMSEKSENNINILAVIEVIKQIHHSNKRIIIHCEAGKNRSVTMAQIYYYYKTGKFMDKKDVVQKFGQDRLDENLKRGSVPVLRKFMKMITGFRRLKDIEKSLQNAGIR